MTDFRGVLVATDGVLAKKVAWFHRTSNGLYTGAYIEGTQFHMSYHTDGKKHQVLGRKSSPWKYGQRLDDFHNWELLFVTAFNKYNIPGKLYKKKREEDAMEIINIRDYLHKEINMIWALFEVGQKALLEKVSASWPRGKTLLFDQIKPWIVIHLVNDEKQLIEVDKDEIRVSGILNEKGKQYEWIAFG